MVGKTKAGFIEEGIGDYLNRLKKYIDFEEKIIPALKNTANLKPSDFKRIEGENILREIKKEVLVILLDENGKLMSSAEFAGFLQRMMNSGKKYLTFVIGGAYGFSQPVYERADHLISLSPMTFPHQLVRLIFLEQLYRAFTIIHNEPYHNE